MSEPSTEPGAQQSYVDAVNETPPAKPEGAPELVPLLQLPRRKRADVIRRLGGLRERQQHLPEPGEDDVPEQTEQMSPEQEKETLDRAAQMFELLADFEEMLAEVAADRDEFTAWVAQADDEQLSRLAGYYLRTFQVGEAPASPAS